MTQVTATLLVCASILSANAFAADPTETHIKLPITRDTWLSNVGKEGDGSNGGASRLKLKSIQEMSLIDIDPTPLKGRIITSATLHVHLNGPDVLHRVTVGTFAADWVEGDATNYAIKDGVSTYNHRLHPDTPWAFAGSNLTAVMLGQGGTIWRMAEASLPDAQRWQTIAVDPAIVAARVAGVSTGFILFDDTGSEWTRDGEKFNFRQFPNRTIDSKDSNHASAPWMEVTLGAADTQPPDAPGNLKSDISDLPAGEAYVSWNTPADVGGAGVIGFLVDIDGKPAPRYLIPAAEKSGQRVIMHLRDLNLAAGATVNVSVRGVDGAGNVGEPRAIRAQVSGVKLEPLSGKNGEPFKNAGPLPKLGNAQIAIIDALDKVQPVTGQMIPSQDAGYLLANHLWDGKTIRLQAARKEIVSFQILLRGTVETMTARLEFNGKPNGEIPRHDFFALRCVESKAGPVPDPLIPLGENGKLSIPDANTPIAGQTIGSLLCEISIPGGTFPSGKTSATLTLSAGGQEVKLPVELTVWDFTLPDSLSFIPEMNCYDLPDDEADYYVLAHRNRTVINRVPYHQGGSMSAGCAPIWDPKTRKLDWKDWDKRFGPYFDGSAFGSKEDGRRGVPLEVFYLPLFENWPTPMEGNYNGDYWADHAFPEQYKKDFVEVTRQFAEHFNQKHWDATLFECFFNGKNNFKSSGWSRGTSPWLLDEPANFQDYWALRFFGELFHQGVNLAPGDAKVVFRADISRPEWQRDSLDHVLDYSVVGGGAFRQYNRLVLDRKKQFQQIVIPYGGSNDPSDSNVQPAAWCLDSWTLGGDGVLPWQTIGENDSWKKADALSLFYPGEPAGVHGPVPSIRLKSYLRGEQDVEYLTILAAVENQSRYLLGPRVREALNLAGEKHGTGFTGGEDAGVIDFGALRPKDLWALRARVGETLNSAHPQAAIKTERPTPRR